jgi:putative transposase
MKDQYPVRQLCQALEVSPSGYYDWQYRLVHPSGRRLEDQQLVEVIEQIHRSSRQTYGSVRVQQVLRQQGYGYGRNRVARLMRQKQLAGRRRRRYRVLTTDSRHAYPVAPNLLAEQPAPARPNEVWVADITYIPTAEGWLYLAGILDLFSRRIVGWAMDQSPDTSLVLRSWTMAVRQRQPPPRLLFHSDRGSQYASTQFRQALEARGARASMSRPANCYDNAVMESFWSTLKEELVYRCRFLTRAQAQAAIFDFLEVFYNRQRLHSSLQYLSPVDFENTNN